MRDPSGGKPGMTKDGLKKLLHSLSGDHERAAELYLHMQGKLIRYFSWHSCAHPEDLADEVLDRVARRLDEGEQVERPVSYILGVARRVLLEVRPKELAAALPVEREIADTSSLRADEDVMGCLDRCLDKLPPESRALLMEYYSPEASARVWFRQKMADRMGLAMNALRNRVLRLRRNLEICIDTCRKGGDTK